MRNRIVIAAVTLCLCACGKSAPTPTAPVDNGMLTVSPPYADGLMANQKQCFTASGGGGKYTWMLTSDGGRQGIFTFTAQAAQACFQSPVYTQFVITVQAADGESTTASGVVME